MRETFDLLSVTAFFSALAHAVVILGISFKLPDIRAIRNVDNTLDVVLINTPNNEEPISADTVSTHDNLGGGNDDKEASSPLPFKAVNEAPIDSVKKTADSQAQTSLAPDRFITAKQAEVAIIKKPTMLNKLKSKPNMKGIDKITTKAQRQLERQRLVAKINQSIEDYQKRPKKEFYSPTTSKHGAAEYLDKWRKRIDKIGNANYPIQAKAQGLYGTLILTVEINRDGTIHNILINRPSAHKLLDNAALRFVRDAAPFESFSDGIDKNTDILVVTRAFHFLKNNKLTSTDASSQR